MTTAIHIDGISKWFERYHSPNQRFLNFFRRATAPAERFYALRDVRLRLAKGQALGLLGRNGAGKSTLMQIIAGTMQPSSGRIEVNGRISPLLELGTGFNPEYTGIENVRLNAAVLGLKPSEIRQKEQEIADFADIGDFIDKPVKTYSSGMFARLAFAVAISVDPEILLVDEILAVGDMGFQQKCLARLREMRDDGLTLVFVSHSPDSVKSICDMAVFLDHGQVLHVGAADQTVDRYLAFIRERANEDQIRHEAEHPWRRPVPRKVDIQSDLRYGSGHVQITEAEILDSKGRVKRTFLYGEIITVKIEIESNIEVKDLCVNILIRDSNGLDLFGTGTFDEDTIVRDMRPGQKQEVYFSFPVITRPGSYGISASVTRVKHEDYSDAFLFDQADGICSYSVAPHPERPIHYKFHVSTSIHAEIAPESSADVIAEAKSQREIP